MRTNAYILVFAFMLSACIEPIEVGSVIDIPGESSGILVVEANLTDESNIAQRILLSRSRKIESDSTVNVPDEVLFNPNTPFISQRGLDVNPERNAMVEVTTSRGNNIVFIENQPGIYTAPETFFTERDIGYTLNITTADGAIYTSTDMRMVGSSQIADVYAERATSDSGIDGMGIFVDTADPANESAYYRYTFEETYKIIAPNWTPFEFDIISEGGFVGDIFELPNVTLKPREREERVCFETDPSQDILLVDASRLENNTVTRNQVRFINSNNPILSHRYSILVKQLSVSFEAFQFYENLRNFTQSELVFSEIQPGPVEGNVRSESLQNKVIGFFDVSSVAAQRIYFNYIDFYPDDPLPPYFGTVTCDRILSPPLGDPERDGPPSPFGPCPQPLIPRIKLGLVEHVSSNDPGICEGPYIVTPTICGDCNIVGSNVVPEFWTEE